MWLSLRRPYDIIFVISEVYTINLVGDPSLYEQMLLTSKLISEERLHGSLDST